MMKMFALYILYTCIILHVKETDSRSMAPRITEPIKNVNMQVEAGSKIDLYCSALLESNSSIDATLIYWLINDTFIDNFSSVQEGDPRVSEKGDQNYVCLILHINYVVPELYNIPITCIANSPWGGDNSTLYLRAFKTGSATRKVIIPITILCLIVLASLVALVYKYLIP